MISNLNNFDLRKPLVFIFSVFVFLSLFFADQSISYDYRFYIAFIAGVGNLSLSDFVDAIVKSFPYFPFGEYGKFEFGFAIFVYVISFFFSGSAAYGVVGFLSVYIKLEVIRRMGGSVFSIFMFFIFFSVLFESNAIRAGLAVAVFMLGLYFFEFLGKRLLGLFLVLLSPTFHLSAFSLVLVLFCYVGIVYVLRSRFVLFLSLVVFVIVFLNLIGVVEFLAYLFGGKIEEYLILSGDFGLYVGASGFNLSSLSSLALVVFFLYLIFREEGQNNVGDKAILGLLFAFFSAGLVLFSGPFSIIGDRIWQMMFPVAFSIFEYLKANFYATSKARCRELRNGYISVFLVLSFSATFIMGVIVVVNILVRYPQSNIFSFITGERDLIPPAVR